mgnify:CR=1 FL=1
MKRIENDDFKIQLIKQNQLVCELKNKLFLIIHDVKNPASVIRGYLELIRDGEFGSLSSEIKEIIQKLILKTTEINSILDKEILSNEIINERNLKVNTNIQQKSLQ